MAKVYNEQEALHSLLTEVVKLIREEEPDFDVAEVVRCKNCKYHIEETRGDITKHFCERYIIHGGNAFIEIFYPHREYCCWAERREE